MHRCTFNKNWKTNRLIMREWTSEVQLLQAQAGLGTKPLQLSALGVSYARAILLPLWPHSSGCKYHCFPPEKSHVIWRTDAENK